MRIVPDSTVTLYSGVEIDNGEQLVFSSRANQTSYFQSKLVRQSVGCTMIRKTGALRIEAPGSVVSGCNYISFINPSFDNKVVYARIVDYDYVNNECTEIAYAIDYWQTWMFDVNFNSSYIEREHLSQAEATVAASNPYDPDIFEFKTAETLPIGKDVEKLNYTYSAQSGQDGLKMAGAVHSLMPVTNTLGVLIKMANVNFKLIDDAYITDTGWVPAPGAYVNLPSYEFYKYLEDIADQEFGFFYITSAMYNYCASRYPSGTFTYTSRKTLGSGWTTAGVSPFNESAFEPPLCYIYDAYGAANSAVGTIYSHMGEFFNMMTRYVTENNLENNTIVDLNIIPNDMMIFAGNIDNGEPFSAGVTPAQPYTPDSKKLMRYPYCYIRLFTPNGDVKELHYERFKDLQNGQNTAYVHLSMDLSDKPTLIAAPYGYKVTGLSQSSYVDTNIEEAIYFDQFPTLPYNIDAFTAQVAAVANISIANRTEEQAAALAARDVSTNETAQEAKMLGMIAGSGMSAGSAAAGGGAGAGIGFVSSVLGTEQIAPISGQMAMERKQYELAAERWTDALSAITEKDGGAIGSQLRLTKAAYAADHYYPSNGVGATNFNYLSFCDMIIQNVCLNRDVLAVYDEYFKHYGYSSGRCGIPRVVNYSKGVSTTTDVPEWVTVDNKSCTYVKTMDAKVTHSMVPVASAIKSMFDAGVRMIKGD